MDIPEQQPAILANDTIILPQTTPALSSEAPTSASASYAGSWSTDGQQLSQEASFESDTSYPDPASTNAISGHEPNACIVTSEDSAPSKNDRERDKREDIAEVIRRFEDIHQRLGGIDVLGSRQTEGNAKSSLLKFDKLHVLKLTAEVLEAYYNEKLEKALMYGEQAVMNYRKRNQERVSSTLVPREDGKKVRFMSDHHLTPCEQKVEGNDGGGDENKDKGKNKCAVHKSDGLDYGYKCRKKQLEYCMKRNIKKFLLELRDQGGLPEFTQSDYEAITKAMFDGLEDAQLDETFPERHQFKSIGASSTVAPASGTRSAGRRPVTTSARPAVSRTLTASSSKTL